MARPKTERICTGYRPATGWPRDKDGRMILVFEYADVPIDEPAPEPVNRRGIQGMLFDEGSKK